VEAVPRAGAWAVAWRQRKNVAAFRRFPLWQYNRAVARLLISLVAVLVPLSARSQSNPLVGTWKLNLEKSKYSPANLAPKSGLWKIEAVEGGIKMVSDAVEAQGHEIHAEYTAKFDGKDYPVTTTIDGRSDPMLDGTTISWRNIDEHTYEYTAKFSGQALGTTHLVISSDGKTVTTSLSASFQGQTADITAVWEKQ
jgi:hypothetical protein